MSKTGWLCIAFFMHSIISHATSITWSGISPNNEMSDAANWDPNSVPGSSDDALFNSGIEGIDTNPVENSSILSVATFNFLESAEIFHFNFNNNSLIFYGAGITGLNTNPTINVTNIDNTLNPGDLISFLGGSGTSGSSIITSSNRATLTGNASTTALGSVLSNLHSAGVLTITNGGRITATNSGVDRATGSGSNGVANSEGSQLKFDGMVTAGDNVAISVTNSGVFSGVNISAGDLVAVVNGSQVNSSAEFHAGDNFTCDVSNIGNDSSSGWGLNYVGKINAAQVFLQTNASFGNDCTINVSNSGDNSSQTIHGTDNIGYLNDQQLYVGGPLIAGDRFRLLASNTGRDSSHGYGVYQVAVINSNSGLTGNQILFKQGATLGDYATIGVVNEGSYTGSNTNEGSSVAQMNFGQIAVGDYNFPGFYAFTAGDNFSLNATNSGINSTIGVGKDSVGSISTDQVVFFTPVRLRNRANIFIESSGQFSGNATEFYVNVGSVGGNQFYCKSSFSAVDDFSLTVNSSGDSKGGGIGGYFIGDITGGQQVHFENSCIMGNNASIIITNTGSTSSNTTNSIQVGSLMGYGKQLFTEGLFQVQDDFVLEITNNGFNNAVNRGGNYAGFMNNNTVDQTGSQVHMTLGASLGDRASIEISNTGGYAGVNTAVGNLISVLSGQQFYSVQNFEAGDDFSLRVSNTGVDNASLQNDNSIATLVNAQVQVDGRCTLGNNALIVVTNSGTNNDEGGTANNIGLITGSQVIVNGVFSAGEDLNLSATNQMINRGGVSNVVGEVTGSQISFRNGCLLNNGSIISAYNSGVVADSQIVFAQGFTISAGSATIQAINEGTVTQHGIVVEGSGLGGNANIILQGNDLYANTSGVTFTIGGLNGDSLSTAKSNAPLLIHTDSTINANFLGNIQDFSGPSPLTKQGGGKQTLSGVNEYTGLTTVEEGTLVIAGSILEGVRVESSGILKGSGSIGGSVVNSGIIAPGQSVGTLSIGGNFTNSGGVFEVEIEPAAASALDIGGSALVSGTVQVVQDPGSYPRSYTYQILEASSGISGAFDPIVTGGIVIGGLPGYSFTLSQEEHAIFLSYSSQIPTTYLEGNNLIIANYLNKYGDGSTISLFNGSSNQELIDGLKSVSPSRNAYVSYITQMIAFSLSTSLSTYLDQIRMTGSRYSGDKTAIALLADRSNKTVPIKREKPLSGWILGFGELAHQRGTNQIQSVNYGSGALLVGVDYLFENTGLFGIAFGYDYTHFSEGGNAGHGNMNNYVLSLYGMVSASNFYFSPALWGLFDQTHNVRNLSLPNYFAKASSNIHAWQLDPHLEIGYVLPNSPLDFTLFSSLDWPVTWQGGYKERGGSPFNVSQSARTSSMVRSETGFKFCAEWEQSWGKISLREKTSYVFEKPFNSGNITANFVGMPSSFTVVGINKNLNLGVVGLGVSTFIGKKRPLVLTLDYEGEFGSRYKSNQLIVTLRKDF